jgi:hypothetical protein
MRFKRDKPAITQDINQYLKLESEKSRTVKEITLELEGQRYQDFFSNYDEDSVKLFINQYAVKKVHYLRQAPDIIRAAEDAIGNEHAEALEMLLEIQQKKLFNLQCLWRAERIHLPSVEICFDFNYWEKNISLCPFLQPVTEEEKELYIEYINSDFYNETDLLNHWQDYSSFIKEVNEEGHLPLPAWYSYYDANMGTEEIMSYPDIRGEKEQAYLTATNSKREGYKVTSPEKPRLNLFEPGILQSFIQRFENRKMMDLCIVYETELKRQNEFGVVEAAIEILKSANVPVSIEPSADWQTAIVQAAWKYQRKERIKNINLVFDEYSMRDCLGISKVPGKWAAQEELYSLMLTSRKQAILDAREKVGETRDFDF